MPENGICKKTHRDILRYEELEALVEAAVRAGITKVRLTGWEPLVRAGVVELVARIAEMKGVEDVGLTTNGVLLAKYAQPLERGGTETHQHQYRQPAARKIQGNYPYWESGGGAGRD